MSIKHYLSLCLSLFIVSIQLLAQNKNGKLSGLAQDVNGKPLPSVSVSLMRLADTSLIKTDITGKDGKFEFLNLTEGDYLLSLSSAGYERKMSDVLKLSGANNELNVQPIVLTEAIKDLAGVTIMAKKPFIETKIDKTVVNVDASPTSAGATALEVLENLPA